MDFLLLDLEDEDRELEVSAWEWRPTLVLIKSFEVVDTERLTMMGFNGTEVTVSKAEAVEIGRRMREELLPKMKPDDRLLLDLAISDAPASEQFDEEVLSRNYSASYAWLTLFAEFCLESNGFEVV